MAASGCGNGDRGGATATDGIAVVIMCPCGAGRCHVAPLPLNPRFLFVCCPRGHADAGGCGFMHWWDTDADMNMDMDTVDIDNTNTTLPPTTPSSPSPSSQAHQHQGAVPPLTCPCGAGPCSVATARNDRSFYFCSNCNYRKWCDAGSSSQCYICREEGHWHRDCPRLPPSAAAAAANNKNICFYCKQEGHYAAHCRFKYRRRK